MPKIKSSFLITLFEQMYAEHWSYEWGAARRGCVDCSGALVYAYEQFGLSIEHGSNTIARKRCSTLHPASDALPGWAVFKVRPWSETANSWHGTAPGDVYHIGIMGRDGMVLNAKSTEAGFSKDKLSKWQYAAPLNAVEYDSEEVIPMQSYATCTGNNVRVRKSPSLSGEIIGHIDKGVTVEIISHDVVTRWAKIRWGDEDAFVSDQYLKQLEVSDSSTEPQTELQNSSPEFSLTTLYDDYGHEFQLIGTWHIKND